MQPKLDCWLQTRSVPSEKSGPDLTFKKCLEETKASIQNYFFHLDLLWIMGWAADLRTFIVGKGGGVTSCHHFLFGFLIARAEIWTQPPLSPSQGGPCNDTGTQCLSAQSRWSICQIRRDDSLAHEHEKHAFYIHVLAADKQRLQIWRQDSLQKQALVYKELSRQKGKIEWRTHTKWHMLCINVREQRWWMGSTISHREHVTLWPMLRGKNMPQKRWRTLILRPHHTARNSMKKQCQCIQNPTIDTITLNTQHPEELQSSAEAIAWHRSSGLWMPEESLKHVENWMQKFRREVWSQLKVLSTGREQATESLEPTFKGWIQVRFAPKFLKALGLVWVEVSGLNSTLASVARNAAFFSLLLPSNAKCFFFFFLNLHRYSVLDTRVWKKSHHICYEELKTRVSSLSHCLHSFGRCFCTKWLFPPLHSNTSGAL